MDISVREVHHLFVETVMIEDAHGQERNLSKLQ